MLEVAKPVKIPVLKGKSLGKGKSLQRNWGVFAGFSYSPSSRRKRQ